MPTLNWIGKKAVENHHQHVPFHLLKDVTELSVGEPGSGNLIVEGDNLLALKALLPYYAGQVKCIYIDPPYNTGNEGWIYNDNVNSPEMKEWLGRVVGDETEDLTRHDKWLCMLYPRLSLLRQFLKEDGVIFVSIDDVEFAHLRLVMDDIFGGKNFLSQIIWQKSYAPRNNAPTFSISHESVLCYARDIDRAAIYRLPTTDAQRARYANPDNDHRGDWKTSDLSVSLVSGQRGAQYQKTGKGANLFEVIAPSGRIIKAPAGRCWGVSEGKFKELNADDRIWWGKAGNSVPQMKRFFSEIAGGIIPQTIWLHGEVGHNQEASQTIKDIFPNLEGVAFPTPKPVRLVRRILQLATKPGDIVLDSFSGSGTTAHATLQLNKEEFSSRRFILVEIDKKIAEEITAERVKRVANGYKNAKGEKVDGLGGGFRFATLGESLFDEKGNIRATVRFAELARHVYFTETGEPLPNHVKATSPLIGNHRGRAIYLLFNGILKDKSPDGGNVLTTNILRHLPHHDGAKVVYGTACRLGTERLRREGIEFKQLPYKLKVGAL